MQSGVAQPLFQAKGPGGTVQPITTRPDVMYHPQKHGFIVCFGTGKYLGDSDYSDTSVQSVYGIWDYGDTVYDLRLKNVSPGGGGAMTTTRNFWVSSTGALPPEAVKSAGQGFPAETNPESLYGNNRDPLAKV